MAVRVYQKAPSFKETVRCILSNALGYIESDLYHKYAVEELVIQFTS